MYTSKKYYCISFEHRDTTNTDTQERETLMIVTVNESNEVLGSDELVVINVIIML